MPFENSNTEPIYPNDRLRRSACPISPTLENVLPFYALKAKQGLRVCLVTLVSVDGVSPRPLGSQIAVSEDGESSGFITGGCAEKAIVHEAMMSMREKRSRVIRIGSGSPWFDIKLPCGAGIEIHFSVSDGSSVIQAACDRLSQRQSVALEIDTHADEISLAATTNGQPRQHCHLFRRDYAPTTRLIVVGSGPYVDSLSRIARQMEFQTTIWTPDEQQARASDGTPNLVLSRTTSLSDQTFDQWTAAVLLFHEHSWEPKLLKRILESNCFYVGALGSRKTHQNRVQALRDLGIPNNQIDRIHGPVGLDISARTPSEIAVSILAEIIQVRNG